MKQRFSSVDVKVIAHELSHALVSLRLANIYDLSSRIFLLKFAKPGNRQQLLVDSGFRAHLTNFTRTAASTPSPFVSKLRKHLKSRRVTSISQVGTDRVIEINFSDGLYRLYLEFFAAGNIVLTDKERNVLSLLRIVSEGDEEVDVSVGKVYNVEAKQNYRGVPPVTAERLKETLQSQLERTKAAVEQGGRKAKRTKSGEELKKAITSGFPEYPGHLIEHAMKTKEFAADTKLDEVLANEEVLRRLTTVVDYAAECFKTLESDKNVRGYIIAKLKEGSETARNEDGQLSAPSREALLYDDFHPFRPSQLDDRPGIHVLEIEGFNKTVDEFYSSIESQKLESRLTEQEEKARRKLETAKQEHEKRLGALQQAQELHIRKAQTIEANTHRVEEAIVAINGLIGQGMDWMDIGKLIEAEQGRGNPVAALVKLPLKLYENTATLLLDEPGLDEDSDSEEEDVTDDEDEYEENEKRKTAQKKAATGDKRLAVDIDLALSPWANARQYYDQKKTAAVKEQKTIQASTRALKSTEKKIEADLRKGLKQEKQTLRPVRKQFWFEKFVYFISSDGYLVLGGKDAQQNELLYRRHLKKGDTYVHADLHGAASVIIKNSLNTPDAPIPPSTLSQAGALSVCTSNAWDSKAVMAAWWVNADQVSKTALTGEYLTTGGFVIRGKKNFLPPSQLLLGFGVLFLISEDSKSRHGRRRYGDGLERTDSSVIEAQGAELEGKTGHKSFQDDEQDSSRNSINAVPDAGNAADDAQAEIEEDHDAAGDDEDEDDDHDDGVSENSDSQERSNPLQVNGTSPEAIHHLDHRKTDHHEDQPNEGNSADEDGENVGDDSHGNESNNDNDNDSENGNEQDSDNEPGNMDDTDITSPVPEASSVARNTQASTLATTNTSSKPLPRGKRSKAKKAAKKYADQDDDDRALAMQLLGSAKAQERRQAELQSKLVREAKLAADKERRRKQHEQAAEKERNREERIAKGEEVDQATNADTDSDAAAQERLDLAQLDHLIGAPLPGDELLAALPLVAPWPALQRCKYKVKLQPGAVKKGKLVKEIVGRWTELTKAGGKVVDETMQDRDRVWPREIELIRAWRVEEVVGVVPVSKARVMWSAGLGGNAAGDKGVGGKKSGSGGARGGKGSKKMR